MIRSFCNLQVRNYKLNVHILQSLLEEEWTNYQCSPQISTIHNINILGRLLATIRDSEIGYILFFVASKEVGRLLASLTFGTVSVTLTLERFAGNEAKESWTR